LRILSLLPCLAACFPHPPPADEQASPEIVLEGATLRIYRGSRLVAWGEAPKATYDRDAATGRAKSVTFHFAPSGRTREEGGRAAQGTEVTAAEVSGNVRAQVADATGGVRVRTGMGDQATTPSAHYDGNMRSATGNEGVEILGRAYHLAAPEYRLVLAEERIELAGGVHGVAEQMQ
jgi:hypothetical protein